LLAAAASVPFVGACASFQTDRSAASQLKALEAASNGRLGVAALDTASGAIVNYRADERFAFCSTFKVMLASAILARSAHEDGLLGQRIRYTQGDLVNYSPVSEMHVADGMTVAELCAAALQYSDNSAANLLIRLLGGSPAVTAFARSIGDDEFRLDRMETELNTAIPGDLRDTTTPAAMARSLQRLALGNALDAREREQLQTWMRGNTTGDARIRAGVPRDWQVADKTGTGDYGTSNDVAVLWPPSKAPIVVVVYFTQREPDAKARNDVIASGAKIVARKFG
jgi:beta-lactamase class A